MNTELEHFLSWLKTDFHLITPIEEEDILRARDNSPFDGIWVSESARIEEAAQRRMISPDCIAAITIAREFIFKNVFETTGSHELSACASDDIELIAKSMACTTDESDFIRKLRASYSCGRIARHE